MFIMMLFTVLRSSPRPEKKFCCFQFIHWICYVTAALFQGYLIVGPMVVLQPEVGTISTPSLCFYAKKACIFFFFTNTWMHTPLDTPEVSTGVRKEGQDLVKSEGEMLSLSRKRGGFPQCLPHLSTHCVRGPGKGVWLAGVSPATATPCGTLPLPAHRVCFHSGLHEKNCLLPK